MPDPCGMAKTICTAASTPGISPDCLNAWMISMENVVIRHPANPDGGRRSRLYLSLLCPDFSMCAVYPQPPSARPPLNATYSHARACVRAQCKVVACVCVRAQCKVVACVRACVYAWKNKVNPLSILILSLLADPGRGLPVGIWPGTIPVSRSRCLLLND